MLSKTIIKDALNYYKKYQDLAYVVSPSLPILYFGNLSGYYKSKIKVLTVGKNPSVNEFRDSRSKCYSYFRFPNWRGDNLIETLNLYFETNPLSQWFSAFEPILNGMNCSFYKNRSFENSALHTDICSPLATFPTWSKLDIKSRTILFDEGHKLWIHLVEELNPDIVLVSIPFNLFKRVFDSEISEIFRIELKKDGSKRKKPYMVLKTSYLLSSQKTAKIIFGQAANKPFDTIALAQKNLIGRTIINA